jgi:hypothetical protein
MKTTDDMLASYGVHENKAGTDAHLKQKIAQFHKQMGEGIENLKDAETLFLRSYKTLRPKKEDWSATFEKEVLKRFDAAQRPLNEAMKKYKELIALDLDKIL